MTKTLEQQLERIIKTENRHVSKKKGGVFHLVRVLDASRLLDDLQNNGGEDAATAAQLFIKHYNEEVTK